MSIIVRENNKLEETKLIYQPTLKVEGTICESIMYIHVNDLGPQLSTYRTLIHLPFFEWTQNWQKRGKSHVIRSLHHAMSVYLV